MLRTMVSRKRTIAEGTFEPRALPELIRSPMPPFPFEDGQHWLKGVWLDDEKGIYIVKLDLAAARALSEEQKRWFAACPGFLYGNVYDGYMNDEE